MTLSRRVFSLLTGLLLLAAGTRAQTPLGQPTLDEQKVQIWCATIKFVYEDTGRPNLKNSLRCGDGLKAFANSIKADSQRVYSALYQPLEGRGVMYKGLGSDKSRVQKLATEIISRLKASPARRANPARLQAVEELAAQLNGYVENGTPPTDVAMAAAPDTTATLSDDGTAVAADEVVADDASMVAPAARSGSGESLMSKFFAPLALIISLLSLFLYVLMRRSLDGFQRELSSRIDKRREEIQALQTNPAAGAAPAGLTPQLRQQIEQLVQLRVAEELGKRPAGNSQPQSVHQGKPQNQPQNQGRNQGQQASSQSRQTPPVAPQPQPQPPAPVNPAPAMPAPTPAPVSAAPVPLAPASAPADEFDSLIAPVQLPRTNWSEATAAPAAPASSVTPAPGRLYAKVPVNGSFSEYDLQDQPQHDSIYEITPDPRVPERATFRVTANSAVHAYAIQSAQYSLRDACTYQQPNGPVSRIVTDKDGTLVKSSGSWQIEQKAAIHFE